MRIIKNNKWILPNNNYDDKINMNIINYKNTKINNQRNKIKW